MRMLSKFSFIRGLVVVSLSVVFVISAAIAKDKNAPSAQRTGAPQLIWPEPPEKPRVKYVEMFSNNFDIEPLKKLSWADKLVGKQNPNVGEKFSRPAGVAIDSKGRVLLVASQRGTVYIIDKEHKEVQRVRGDRGIALQYPYGLGLDSQDNFYVTDPPKHAVYKFNSAGSMVQAWGKDQGLNNPTGVAFDEPRRRMYVVDSHAHTVFIFNMDNGQKIGTFGKRGIKPGDLNYPVSIAVNPQDGMIAITNTVACTVELFDANYKFIRRFGKQGVMYGNLARPKGLTWDNEGHIWVVDAAYNNFQIFDPKGNVYLFVGSFGNNPGQFNLPSGIFISRNNQVVVADQLNDRVQIFHFFGGK